MSRQLLAAAALVATLAVGACGWKMHEETRHATAPASAAQGVAVHTRNGAVTVEEAEGGEVMITAKPRARTPERLALMRVLAEQDEKGVLQIRVLPADGEWWSGEGCAIHVKAPRSVSEGGVLVRTNNGRIEVSDVAGDADLDTSNGVVAVRGCGGAVKVDSSNGNLELLDVAGPVHADTSNGSIALHLRDDAAGPVDLDTSNGSVTLAVGRGFRGDLSASTSNGSIKLPSSDSFKMLSKKRRSVKLRFGDGGEASRIDTSNGRVTLSVYRRAE